MYGTIKFSSSSEMLYSPVVKIQIMLGLVWVLARWLGPGMWGVQEWRCDASICPLHKGIDVNEFF